MGYLSSGVLASFIACIVGPFIGLDNRLKLFSLWPKFANWFLHLTCDIKVEVIGKENLPDEPCVIVSNHQGPVSYTHLRAHETRHDLVCRLLLEKKKL